MRTSNPALTPNAFAPSASFGTEAMTVNGTIHKTGILLLCVMATSMWTWNRFYTDGPASVQLLMLGGAIGGLIMAMVTIFKQQWAPVTAPVYALLEGLFLGAISAQYSYVYDGIAIQAVALTLATCVCLLMAYRSGLIRATEKFKVGIVAATGGIFLVYMASMLLGFFGVQIPGIFGNGLIGIGFSLFVVVIAALNLVLDFDFIERGAQNRAPKYLEWYGAFGLMVTLVWLYIELLRLLAKLRDRR